MKRILFSLALSLLSAAAVAGTDTPAKLNIEVTITSGDKVIATAVADVANRNPVRFSGTAENGGPTYLVKVTPALLADMPGQVLVRSSIRVVSSTLREIKTDDTRPALSAKLPETQTCLTSATSRIPLGTATKVLSGGNVNLPSGEAPIPGCSLTVTVTRQ